MDNRIYISGREFVVNDKAYQAIKRYHDLKLGTVMQLAGAWGKSIDITRLSFIKPQETERLDWSTLNLEPKEIEVEKTEETATFVRPQIDFYSHPEQLRNNSSREARVNDRMFTIKNLELDKHFQRLKAQLDFIKIPEVTNKDIVKFPTFTSHSENYVKHDVIEYLTNIPLPDTGSNKDLSRYFVLERIKVYCPSCRKSIKDELRLFYPRELSCLVRPL